MDFSISEKMQTILGMMKEFVEKYISRCSTVN